MTEASADERYLVVDGRKWRRSDPAIPELLRVELVAELMAARRAVGAALRADDGDAEAVARARVQDAKLALGERGPAWWEQADAASLNARAQATGRALLRHRHPSTICPSDVARVVGGSQWRSTMDPVRAALLDLALERVLVVRQRGEDVTDLRQLRGPVRFAAGEAFARG